MTRKSYAVNFPKAHAYLIEIDARLMERSRMQRDVLRTNQKLTKAIKKYVAPVEPEIAQLAAQDSSFQDTSLWEAVNKAHTYKRQKKAIQRMRKGRHREEKKALGTIRVGGKDRLSPDEKKILRNSGLRALADEGLASQETR